jgi:hypothetical protein
MSSKEVIERAFGNIPKEIPMSNWDFDVIPGWRGFKYYYLKIVRFFTR